MRTRKSDWFEVKFQYEKTQEDGMQKKVTELYAVDAKVSGEGFQVLPPMSVPQFDDFLIMVSVQSHCKTGYV